MNRMVRAVGLSGLGLILAASVQAQGRPIAGVEIGAAAPVGQMKEFADTGGVIAPFAGYMFNDYIGIMGQVQGTAHGNDDEDPKIPGSGPQESDVTGTIGGGAGPRIAFPSGKAELYGVGLAGAYTGLSSSSAVTDTSVGFSAGGGINYRISDSWLIGGFGRFNRYYQRVHGREDVKFITAGIGLTYSFAEPPPPPPPPPPVAEVPPPPPPPPAKKKIVLRGVHFDFDKAVIRADARPVLDEAVSILKREGGIAVIAEGHTDSVGTDAYNQGLSMRRASAVRDYLIQGGIAPARIRVEGHGESRPVASNATDDGRAQNRRVELKVLD